MTSREWKALIGVHLLGIALMAWLIPLATKLPPVVPAHVLAATARMRGYRPPMDPLLLSSGVNAALAGLLITVACAFLYLWWTTRPLVIRCMPRKPSNR